MLAFKNTDGNIVLEAVKTDGTPCGWPWGGPEINGLAVWQVLTSINQALKPNYPNNVSKNLIGIIANGTDSMYMDASNQSPDVPHSFIVNPACVTNARYGGDFGVTYEDSYVFNRSDPFDSEHTSEKRWSSMNACHRTVSYTPVTCSISTSAGTVNLGENLTIDILGGSKLPVKIDGGDYSPGYAVRLFVERSDFAEISPLPASLTQTSGLQPGNRFYYQLGTENDCRFSSSTGTCSHSVTISDLPAGSYNFHCDIPEASGFEQQNCTGDPWCSFEGGDPANTCSGWFSCSDGDNANVIVNSGPPEPPTNLISSCSAADTLELNWTAVSGASTYLIRVDDGNPGDGVTVIGYEDSVTCKADHPSWDVCLEVPSAITSIDVVVNPTTFTAASWSVYSVNSGGQPSVSSELKILYSCIPNCRDIEGHPTVTQGDTALYSAIFESAHGFLGGTFSVKGITDPSYSANIQWPVRNFGDATTLTQRSDGVFSWDTTTVPPGRYNLYCRTWNDSKAECQGDSTTAHTPPIYTCKGGVASKEVEIVLPKFTISGMVYDGLGQGTLTYCTNSGSATAWNGGDAMSVAVSGLTPAPSPSGTTLVNGTNGTYSSNPFESNGTDLATVQMSGIPSGYSIICPAGAQYSGIPANVDTTGVDFYISQIKGPWWQTRSGLAYGTAITSNLPRGAGGIPDPLCVLNSATCVPFLITGALGDVDPYTSAGIPMASAINGTADFDSQHKNAGGAFFDSAIHSDAALAKETYAVLSRRFDLTTATSLSSPLTSAPSGATPQVDANVYKYTGDLDISPSPSWNIAGQKIVIFVDGSVAVNGTGAGPFITVGTDSFFAVIATGNITFSQDIGATIVYGGVPIITPQIEGMYVADGTFTVEASSDPDAIDKMFIGAGSFVGWNGVSLPRDFETVADPTTGLLNNYVPTDTFIFRPDFILNTPELMKRSTFNWREINSITQD